MEGSTGPKSHERPSKRNWPNSQNRKRRWIWQTLFRDYAARKSSTKTNSRGKEEKLELELPRLFGTLGADGIQHAELAVSAHCHRVAVQDGHLEAVSLELERPVRPAEAIAAFEAYQGDVSGLGLPSAPARPIEVRHEPDRPQPRMDRDRGDGMVVVVGRVRSCPVLGLKFELLSHNAVRGAAGGALLNAELLASRGRLPRRASA